MSTNDSSKTPSNNQIVPFDFESIQVRVIRDANGEPWFIAADVCKVLGYANTSKAIKDHVDDDDRSTLGDLTTGYTGITAGGSSPIAINESGLFALILSSTLPKAKQFKKWVTSDVLPSIRKTGQYSVTQNQDPILAMLDGIRETRLAQIALEQRVNQIEARQDAVDTELHHFTVIGYFRTRGKAVPDKTTLQTIGKQVSNVSRQLGYTIGKVKDERYGTVHTYHELMLEQVLGW